MSIHQLKQENLSGNKIGVFFGTLSPMHVGHQAEIYKAAALNDGVIVIVSGYTNDRGDQIGLPLAKRFRYLREAFSDEPTIKVAFINEDGIPQMPNGWIEWTKLLVKTVQENVVNVNARFTFYTGEADYQSRLQELLPQTSQFQVSLMDRTILDISGTAIRQDPIGNWDYINRVFRRHFTKKVAVLGADSTGKSTLVRRLARTSNSPFSLEYAVQYQKEANVNDDELDVKDYIRIVNGQYDANSREINSPSNNGLTIFDTDVLVAQTYAQLYLDSQDQKKLTPLFENAVEEQSTDLILILPPDDNNPSQVTFHQTLLQLIQHYHLQDKTVVLDGQGGGDDPFGYYARYLQALDAIQDRTGFDIKHLEG